MSDEGVAGPGSDTANDAGTGNSTCIGSDTGTGWTEAQRLAAVERYGILDSGREPIFDDIAELAADLLDAPIAVVNFIASDRQWFKAEVGIGTDTLPLDVSICRHAILQPGVLVVPDLTQDPRFAANPLVDVADGLRFYAGALLETAEGLPLGTVCVLDHTARPGGISRRQERALRALASQTMAQLETRRTTRILQESEARLAFLDRLGAATAPLGDADTVLETTTRMVGEHLGVAICAYADMDEDENGFTIRGNWTAPGAQSIVGRYQLAAFGQRAVEELGAGRALVLNDVVAELAAHESATFQSIGLAATICMPLVKDGKLAALMAVHDKVPRPWTKAEQDLVREVTDRSWAHVERVAAVAELRTSEERFRLTADAVPQIVWITNAEGRVEFFNKQWSDYTGARYEPTTAADVAAGHVHPDDVAHTMAGFEEARRHGSTFCVEHRIRSASGEYRWFLVRAEPYRDPQTGEIVRWFGASVDIHDRRSAEAALRESEARLRLVQAAGGIGSFDYDLQADNAICSPEYFQILGLPEGHPINRETWAAAVHPEDREKAVAALDAAVATRAPFDHEYRIVRADNGAVRWITGRAAVIFDAEDRPWRYVGGNIDVTDRKTIEEQLRVLNERLEQEVVERTAERNRVWEMSRDLFAVMGFDGYLKAINPAWEGCLGRPLDVLLATPVGDQVHPDDLAGVADLLARLRRGESVLRFEDRLRHADGSWRWISWSLVPGDAEVFYAVGRDVTAEKEAAIELEQAQAALRQSQKMEAMGQLTGGVAHDFNNLLTPIIGSLDMLMRRGVGSERERRLIDGALQSAERAKTLVQRLLAFARRQPLQPTAVDVRALILNMAELVASTSGPRIDIRLDLGDELPAAVADANQLEMAVLNLAVNARDAMPDGGVLTIAAAPTEVAGRTKLKLPPGRYVRLSVADTGTGMDEETIARAVEPFFSTKGIGKGTGLGLSMVHGLARQLNGDLSIDSAPGRGTRVDLWLPVSTDHAAEPAESDESVRVAGAGTALLVDDEDLVRMSTADMLLDLGYQVVEARCAEDALTLVEQGLAPDILITDHLMPGMNGVELARALKVERPCLPVLIVSGYAEEVGLEPGVVRLTKPFRNAELAEGLSEALQAQTVPA